MSADAPLVEFLGRGQGLPGAAAAAPAGVARAAGAVVSIGGIDALGAEVLVNLMTAAIRPTPATVRLFGTSTAAIDDYDGWLRMLDGLGLLTDRAVLLGQCTVAQNIALPLTLEIEPIRADVLPRVTALAAEVGITAGAARHAGRGCAAWRDAASAAGAGAGPRPAVAGGRASLGAAAP